MAELRGFVDHIIYRNPENAYSVLVLIPEGTVEDEDLSGADEITCTGIFPSVTAGESVQMTGDFVEHKSYGKQFLMKTYEEIIPQGQEAIKRYLGSGAIKGVGEALAARIVKKFKADTLRIIEQEPERLSEVKGISDRMAASIADQVNEKRDMRDAMIFLGQYGISMSLALRIYQEYGPKTYGIIRENPYQMAEDIPRVGFKTADEIAKKVGISIDSKYRVGCGILYALSEAAGQGHTCLPMDELVYEASMLLSVSGEDVENGIRNLLIEGKLKERDGFVYLMSFYTMEDRAAGLLLGLSEPFDVSPSIVEAVISDVESEENITLDEVQREAVICAAKNGVSILTGGPGTGKTTTIRAMIRFFESQEKRVELAAPTGRAAKRMSEATDHPARTIHRLLEVHAGSMEDSDRTTVSRSMFDKNEDNPLETDVIIIDEMSMVDISLMYALLKAIPRGTRLVMVGDENQLPSVGPGNVLSDMISSGAFSTITLKKIFRQKDLSDIVLAAHQVQNGEVPRLDNDSKEFFIIKRNNADHIIGVVKELVEKKLPPYVHASSYDIQVLTPTRKGLVGVSRLNELMQSYLNPHSGDKEEYAGTDVIFREGDKVMQIKNDYQLEWEITGRYGIVVDSGTGVFNGDIGIIKRVDNEGQKLVVEYEDAKKVVYPFKNTDELEHAYAVTIHKSQGSEYPAVVIPLLPGARALMNRNLIYTAITRAKSCVVLVGDPEVFVDMIKTTDQKKRYSGLLDRINERT